MECDKILEQLCAELSEDIHSELCGEIRRHLDACSACREQLQSVRNTVALYRCLKEKNVPGAIHRRLMALLKVDAT
jgi:predicted anti-sigma-YlaC factor YlaD